jgi:hypothetical protein
LIRELHPITSGMKRSNRYHRVIGYTAHHRKHWDGLELSSVIYHAAHPPTVSLLMPYQHALLRLELGHVLIWPKLIRQVTK